MSAPVSFLGGRVTLHAGDCRASVAGLPDASIDAVVTDPPYALVSIQKRFGGPNAAATKDGDVYARSSAGFMGKQWDTGETAFAAGFWAEILRVLKPGGHLVAFSGTRTYHRLACAIEDAGFEIRDQLAWTYGTGFPKSHDVSKGIDRHNGDARPVIGKERLANDIRSGALLDAGGGDGRPAFERDVTAAASAASAAWEGWGTALKPAWEPIVLARKPLVGTVAENVLAHGAGALNIDGCRIAVDDVEPNRRDNASIDRHGGIGGDGVLGGGAQTSRAPTLQQGRFPANIVHDGSAEVRDAFGDAPGALRPVRGDERAKRTVNAYGDFGRCDADSLPRNDAGSAARFFYSAKADADDRIGSKHPTVKPVDLMQWLCRLVTPPGGVVLDPFAGTGTTGEAAWREGFSAVLCEREPDYCADVARRMALAEAGPATRRLEAAKARGRAQKAAPLFDLLGGEGAP